MDKYESVRQRPFPALARALGIEMARFKRRKTDRQGDSPIHRQNPVSPKAVGVNALYPNGLIDLYTWRRHLDRASIGMDIAPFAEFIAERVAP